MSVKNYTEKYDELKGVHIIATPHDNSSTQLLYGVDLWLESPFAAVVLEESRASVCHNCWSALHTVLTLDQKPICCPKCAWTVYCSETCYVVHKSLHELICPYIGKLVADIADRYGLTQNRVRLLLTCLASRYKEEQESKKKNCLGDNIHDLYSHNNESNNNSDDFSYYNLLIQKTYDDVVCRTSHLNAAEPTIVEALYHAAQDMINSVPQHLKTLTVEDLIRLSFVSDANAFGVTIPSEILTSMPELLKTSKVPPRIIALFVAGMGLFPQSAKLNHSCYPSCHFYLQFYKKLGNPVLRMRTIRSVKTGEELTDSYVDLYTDRITRRRDLLRTKNFFCMCQRCAIPLPVSFDRFLDGKLCPHCFLFSKTSWSHILKDAGNALIKRDFNLKDNNNAILLSTTFEIIDEIANNTTFFTSGFAYCDADYITHSTTVNKPIGRISDDPRCIPVYVPNAVHTEYLTIETQQKLLERPLPLSSYECEQCHRAMNVEQQLDLEKRATSLWNRVTETFRVCNHDPYDIRRRIGLFFKLFSAYIHPFHVWFYRASQRLVDTTTDILSAEHLHPEIDKHADNATIMDIFFMDIILLRYQLACQKTALPMYHEECFLTVRVLVSVLGRLLSFYNDPLSNIDTSSYPSSSSVIKALERSENYFNYIYNIIYG